MRTSRCATVALGCAALTVIAGCASASQSAAGTPSAGKPSAGTPSAGTPSAGTPSAGTSGTIAARPAATVSGSADAKRSAREKIPAAAKAVTISENLGVGANGKPPAPVTVTAPAKVRKLAAAIDGLPLFPPGMYSCPAAIGDGLKLQFRAAPGQPPLAVAIDLLSGCLLVGLAVDGKRQPDLRGLSAATIFTIADLPWTVPPVR